MTIRNKFNLIAAIIVLPSILAVASYIYSARSEYLERSPQVAGTPRTRRWVEKTLSGDGEKRRGLSSDIKAIAIRRDDGLVVFSSAQGLAKGESMSPAALLDRVTSAYPGEGYIAESVGGKPGGSYVAVVEPEAEAWYLDLHVIGTIVFLALECLLAIVGTFMMLKTSSSLLVLGEAARRIAGGDLAFSLEGRGNDEVTMLYRAFDDMRRELAEAQDSRSRFLMGVSHDLRTPLTSIKGYLQALEEGMAKDPATHEKFVGILRAKAELLGSRIQELIEFATLETAVGKANLVDLRLQDFLLEIASAAASDAEARERKFNSRIRIDSRTVIKADPRLFLRVLENLLSNAIRYTRSGDEVALEADEDGECICIVVRDNGPGIPTEEKKRVFDEFYRGSRARNEEGLGLGLSIVKSVVSAHGWKVRLEEEYGAGASFLISIPKHRL
jgi:signal transduction histidine kinase